MKRLAIFVGFILAAIVFGWHVYCDNDLLYCAWMALVVQLISTVVVLAAMRMIGRILLDHLKEQREEIDQEVEEHMSHASQE